jgi:hypothetical protein
MRFIGHLRAIETDSGLINLVGASLERIEPGARIVITPTVKPTSGDWEFELFASSGPPDPERPRTIWDGDELPVRLGRLDGDDCDV